MYENTTIMMALLLCTVRPIHNDIVQCSTSDTEVRRGLGVKPPTLLTRECSHCG